MATKAPVVFAEFKVPTSELDLDGGPWVWEVGQWRGVKRATLQYLLPNVGAWLEVEATETAMRRVRRFCAQRDYPEVEADDAKA